MTPSPIPPEVEALTPPVGVDEACAADAAARYERRGRLWILVAVVLCPCHLPLTLALLGGTMFGGLLTARQGWTFVGFGIAYVVALVVAFAQLRRARRGDCDTCVPPER